MPHRDDIIEACQIVAAEEGLRAKVKGALKGGAIAASSAMTGGLLGGPAGLFIGTAVGTGIYAYRNSKSYTPVCDIIQNCLTPSQKQKLASSVGRIFDNTYYVDNLMALMAVISGNKSVRNAVIDQIIRFFSRELEMNIK